jgi:hypothetical protein
VCLFSGLLACLVLGFGFGNEQQQQLFANITKYTIVCFLACLDLDLVFVMSNNNNNNLQLSQKQIVCVSCLFACMDLDFVFVMNNNNNNNNTLQMS